MNKLELIRSWEEDGDWIQTRTGRAVNPLALKVEVIDIFDIGHALSMLCRFAGHVRVFYSVAEHSVRCSYLGSQENALWKLLHDATEAYLVDMPRPVKRSVGLGEFYKIAEYRAMAVIAEKYGLSMPMPEEVKRCDEVMLITEQRDLLGPQVHPWECRVLPLDERIKPWSPFEARVKFLVRYQQLTNDVVAGVYRQ